MDRALAGERGWQRGPLVFFVVVEPNADRTRPLPWPIGSWGSSFSPIKWFASSRKRGAASSHPGFKSSCTLFAQVLAPDTAFEPIEFVLSFVATDRSVDAA